MTTQGKWEPLIDTEDDISRIYGVGVLEKYPFGTITNTIFEFPLPETNEEYLEIEDETKANAQLISLAGNLNQKYDLELLTSFITTIENRQEFGCPSAIVSKALKNIKR